MEEEREEGGEIMRNFQKVKFSEMPGFEGYKKALEEHGVFIEDRTVGFTVPESVDNDMYEELWVIGSRYEIRNLYAEDYDEQYFGPKEAGFENAQVVQCSALFAYGEWAVFENNWQWVVVDNEYVGECDVDFYWCTAYAWPANMFNAVLKAFNEEELQEDYWPLNTTSRTNSTKWMTWLIDDVLDYVKRLREERNQ